MPVTSPYIQKQFKLSLVHDMPVVAVEVIDDQVMIMCCPLCGCIHLVLEAAEYLAYTPLCQILPELYKANVKTWRSLHPDIARYRQLHLTGLQAI